MPNADTMGNMIREKLNAFIAKHPQAIGIELFGAIGYLSLYEALCLYAGKHLQRFCRGIVLPKICHKIRTRQNGRIITKNIRSCVLNKSEILKAINEFRNLSLPEQITIYGEGSTRKHIIQIIKSNG